MVVTVSMGNKLNLEKSGSSWLTRHTWDGRAGPSSTPPFLVQVCVCVRSVKSGETGSKSCVDSLTLRWNLLSDWAFENLRLQCHFCSLALPPLWLQSSCPVTQLDDIFSHITKHLGGVLLYLFKPAHVTFFLMEPDSETTVHKVSLTQSEDDVQ